MNRMTPLISRRPVPRAIALPIGRTVPLAGADPARWLDDVRLFATGWIGGLIFFGTLIG